MAAKQIKCARGGGEGRSPKPARWIACASTKEVARAVAMFVRPGDVVAEIGSQLRDASHAVCDAVGPEGRASLVDVRRKFPGKARVSADRGSTSAMRREGDEEEFSERYKDRATFSEVKGFDAWRDALFFKNDGRDGDCESTYDALVVDISANAGNDLVLTSISLVRDFLAINNSISSTSGHEQDDGVKRHCRVVIVKSGGLQSWARRLVHAVKLIEGGASDSIRLHLSATDDEQLEPALPVVVASVGVDEYRQTMFHVVKRGDYALEVGSHCGVTTALLHGATVVKREGESCGGCLGVDIGPKIVEVAKRRYPDVPFAVADAWRTGRLLGLREALLPTTDMKAVGTNVPHVKNQRGYDIIYVDIGGISGGDGLLEAISLLTGLSNALEPRCIVIKSLCMRRLASSLVPFSEIWLQEKRRERQNLVSRGHTH